MAKERIVQISQPIETVSKHSMSLGGEAAYNISIARNGQLAFKTFNFNRVINFAQYGKSSDCVGCDWQKVSLNKKQSVVASAFCVGYSPWFSELIVASSTTDAYTKVSEWCRYLHSPLVKTKLKPLDLLFQECSGLIYWRVEMPQSLVMPLKAFEASAQMKKWNLDESIIYVSNGDLWNVRTRCWAWKIFTKLTSQSARDCWLSNEDYDMIVGLFAFRNV